jgi:hypothetical protein
MLLRNAAIAVLVATSPIAAAGQVSKTTQSWWPKLASATAQLIILKPAIAIVFCVGLSLTGRSTDVETLLVGMLVLVLAVIAWPAVARFFTFTSIQVGGGAGLGALLGFAAARGTAGSPVPTGVEPDEFSRRLEARTMTGFEQVSANANVSGAPTAGATGGALASGPAGLAAAAASVAQRTANTLTGRMEQMAGHAGMPGANPYAQPAGTPRPAGYQARRAIPVPGQPGLPTPPAGLTGTTLPPLPGPGPGDDPRTSEGIASPGTPSTAAPTGSPPHDPAPNTAPDGHDPASQDTGSAPPSPPPEVHHDPPATDPGGHDDTDRGAQ